MGKYDEVSGKALEVTVRYQGDSKEDKDRALEKALQQFKKLVNREGILFEVRERASFQSPGRKRYLQRLKSKYRMGLKKDKQPSYKKKMSFVDKKIVPPDAPLIRLKDGKPIHEQPRPNNRPNDRQPQQPRNNWKPRDKSYYSRPNSQQRPVHTPTQR